MKTIVLTTLCLRNFKGTESQEIDFSGASRDIYGANESGKSTLCTAFNWLLTGKDEFDRKDYQLKNTYNPALNIEPHEVEAVLQVDGREIKLRRVYLEVYTKQKGKAKAEFTGHTTNYFFNDVPCSEKEYNQRVAEIIPGDLIKLLTNPIFFNTQDWQRQRAELTKIAGPITDNDVFDQIATEGEKDADYSTLFMVLKSGKSLEDYKKELAAKKALLKKAAVEFSPRIEEVKRGMPQVKDWAAIEANISQKAARVQTIEASLESATTAATVASKALLDKQQFIYKREAKLQEIKNGIRVDLQKKQDASTGDLVQVQQSIKLSTQRIAQLEQAEQSALHNIAQYEDTIPALNASIEKLRAEWKAINAEPFTLNENECMCPTCARPLEADVIEKKHDELQQNFIKDKARRLAEKVATSNGVKEQIQRNQNAIQLIKDASQAEAITAEKQVLAALQFRAQELPAHAGRPSQNIDASVEALWKLNEEALYLFDEINGLKADLALEQLTGAQDFSALRNEKAVLNVELTELRAQLANRDRLVEAEARVTQLQHEESVNAQAIADIENLEFQQETYTRAKMDILEKRVNAMFKYVTFRLFEKQVNGGTAETCVCEYKGVAFPTLNTAAKVLAGLDVINTLSAVYGIAAPVFCDNRESVTYIPASHSQIISLFVSPADKAIRVEEPAPIKKRGPSLATV